MVRYEINAYDFQSGLKEIHWHIRKSWNHGTLYVGEKMTVRVQKVRPSHIAHTHCFHSTIFRRGHVHPITDTYLGGVKKRCWVIYLAISSPTPSFLPSFLPSFMMLLRDIVLSIEFFILPDSLC